MIVNQFVLPLSSLCRQFLGCSLHKHYSMWPTYFVEPVYHKDKLKELTETGEKEKLKTVPIKASRNEYTVSVFHDPVIEKFANYVMRKGKKALAHELIEKTFENIKRKQLEEYYKTTDDMQRSKIVINPREVFHLAVSNCKPVLQLTPVKRGGATYQVPVPVSEKRATFIAMNWFVETAKNTPKGVMFHDTLAKELIEASKNSGEIVKRKIDLHRRCEENRAYAHYRWG